MDLPRNHFKHAIRAGKQQIGLWVSLANAYCAEVVAGSGFDWLLLDGEHSPNDPLTVLAQLQAIAPYPVTPIVRTAWNEKVLIKRYLDVGAQSLLLPYVQTEDEAAAAVAAIRFPTRGVRGVAGVTRASRFGRVTDYARRAEEELCLLVQIETRAGLDNLEKIARMDGIDGVFIGPADLSASLGHVGQPGHPEVQAAIADAIARIVKAGKAAGILTPDEALARHYLKLGATFVAVGLDTHLLVNATNALAARFKNAVAAVPASQTY